ncbi:hypothetical protein [Gottfriedia acidiceleris]|uniref:hypothetical protein n=1 Tax=Gottfriedia acidiceleris TaxID=371036 RepID=UPI002FFE5D8B
MIRDGAIKYIPSYTKEPGAQGLIFDIYADRVVINGRDFAKKSTIATWTINNYTPDALQADQLAPTAPSKNGLVKRFANSDWIDNAGIVKSLQEKLGNNDLKGFLNEVRAQSGKHITTGAAEYLLRDAQYLLSQQ